MSRQSRPPARRRRKPAQGQAPEGSAATEPQSGHEWDATDDFLARGAFEIEEYLELVRQRVPYSSVFAWAPPPLTIPTFRRLRDVAMLELFFEEPQDRIAQRLKVSEAVIEDIRGHRNYKDMQTSLLVAAETVAGIDTVLKGAQAYEGPITRSMLVHGLTTRDGKTKSLALAALADRLSPKQARGDSEDGKKYLRVPPNLIELVRFALQGVPGVLPEAGEVDASRLNVPGKLVAAPAPVQPEGLPEDKWPRCGKCNEPLKVDQLGGMERIQCPCWQGLPADEVAVLVAAGQEQWRRAKA